MARIRVLTKINAPIERCFDLARSIDLHVQSQSHHGEKAIAGVTSSLIGLGEEVTWRARHFGLWQTMTSRITRFERPTCFRDERVRGAFRSFEHDHYFEVAESGTIMTDVCDFEAPLGPLGRLVSHLVLTRHLTLLLQDRGQSVRRAAESDEWRKYLSDDGPGSSRTENSA
jgi:ligand-binding SRPBCC domain-containing protein